MIKVIFKRNFYLIFAIAFAIPVIVLGMLFAQSTTFADVAKNGIETEGYIIQDSYRSNLMVNDVDYYHISFYFYDENEVMHQGKTSDAYTYYEVVDINELEYIMIKYDPNTFDAVESTYDFSKDSSTIPMIIMLAIFGICDLIFWIISIITVKTNIDLIKVEKYGTEYNAMVSHTYYAMRVNNVRRYKVYYTWTNDMGQKCEGSSLAIYDKHQAQAFEDVKKITIKALGDKSYIVTDPNEILANSVNFPQEPIEQNNEIPAENHEYCDYCGQKLSSEDNFCPNCGTQREQ